MDPRAYVQELVEASREAQQRFAAFEQGRVDRVVRAAGKSVYDHAESLARLAVEETGMGRYEDKVQKNKGKSKVTWYRLKGQKSRGIVRRIESSGIVEIAHPMGVIGAITPTTNPTMTPMHNAMIALKGGNSLIVCPHPRSRRTAVRTVEIMNEAILRAGAPENLIQIVPEPTVEMSRLVMALCDVCISTGGSSMVSAAYSSGKPAFGVGQGNVQALVDRDVPLTEVVPMLVKGRVYDYGVLCTCEQSVFCPSEKLAAMMSLFALEGAYCVETPREVNALRATLFHDGVLNKECVGIAPARLAAMSGFSVPQDTRLLVVRAEGTGSEDSLSREKLCPVLSVYGYRLWEDAVEMACANLRCEGMGHSAIIHSNTQEHIEYAAVRLPVSRIGVNQIGSSGLGGTLTNGLNPTGTLGCGSWGNNSLSENLWFTHLINTSRIAYPLPAGTLPTDEEIWAEETL